MTIIYPVVQYSAQMQNTSTRITSEKEVTVDYIVNEADTIWKKTKKMNVNQDNTEAINALMAQMQSEHPEFSKSYPIVLRYICQMKQYSTKALTIWLNKIKHSPWKSEEEYLDAQADYVTILFRTKNPRAPMTQVNNIRRNIRVLLGEETKTFKRQLNEFDSQIKYEEKVFEQKNTAELLEFMSAADEQTLVDAETIRVITEQPSNEPCNRRIFKRLGKAPIGCGASSQMDNDTTFTGITADDLLG